ncbi:MAG: class I SAM-dependent methyltransferase [Bryobacterales bacterium]|nr:class I SAM-dependent methyltransferase [Bryobacterales bacterium]
MDDREVEGTTRSLSAEELRELVVEAASFHPWDAMAPAALEAIASRGPFQASAETGCGGSTILLSRISESHTAFAIEGESRTITALRARPDLRVTSVNFVEGETKTTLPVHSFSQPLQLILLDGPHAYPQPQMEFVYLFEHLSPGGWLVLDDLQIRSVHDLYRFLLQEEFVELEDVVVRTAFLRKVAHPPGGPDGWHLQRWNRWPVLRYCWRDVLRNFLRGSH